MIKTLSILDKKCAQKKNSYSLKKKIKFTDYNQMLFKNKKFQVKVPKID